MYGFLSTLSLRRATRRCIGFQWLTGNFYPRSPCGERPQKRYHGSAAAGNFYPRSPCGERHMCLLPATKPAQFLSTLSLRRATNVRITHNPGPCYFYPRSPCGERRPTMQRALGVFSISIHALLAESDPKGNVHYMGVYISIHALLAESDPWKLPQIPGPKNFYPRSPCGERHPIYTLPAAPYVISIHALLAESDLANIYETVNRNRISIHALLAESDCCQASL